MLNITSGGMSGGYKTYLSRLVPLLARHQQVEALLVGMPEKVDIGEWKDRAPSVQWLPLRCAVTTKGREVSRNTRETIEQFSPDVFFIPTSRYFAMNGTPVVSMVRNMMPMMPQHSIPGMERLRNWGRWRQMRHAVERSSRVIAVSHFVRDHLTSKTGLAQDRVGVVYHGVDVKLDHDARKPPAVPYCPSVGFVFTAGEIYAYRGLEDLVRAWARLRHLSNLPPLVIAGGTGQGMNRYYNGLERLVQKAGLDSQIHFVGRLAPREMAWCYRNCSAFVMTSRVEACPNIALEAMAHGCISIAADNPPLPEMFHRAALYYPPGDCEVLADRIQEALQLAAPQKRRFRECALQRATRFDWALCAERTVAELTLAAKNGAATCAPLRCTESTRLPCHMALSAAPCPARSRVPAE